MYSLWVGTPTRRIDMLVERRSAGFDLDAIVKHPFAMPLASCMFELFNNIITIVALSSTITTT